MRGTKQWNRQVLPCNQAMCFIKYIHYKNILIRVKHVNAYILILNKKTKDNCIKMLSCNQW